MDIKLGMCGRYHIRQLNVSKLELGILSHGSAYKQTIPDWQYCQLKQIALAAFA